MCTGRAMLRVDGDRPERASSKGNPLGHPRWRVEGMISFFTVEDEAVRPVKASCREKRGERCRLLRSIYIM